MAELSIQDSTQALDQALSEYGYKNEFQLPQFSSSSGSNPLPALDPILLQNIAIVLLVAGLLVLLAFVLRNLIKNRDRKRRVIKPAELSAAKSAVTSVELQQAEGSHIVELLMGVLESLKHSGLELDREYQTLREIRPLLFGFLSARSLQTEIHGFDDLCRMFQRSRYRGDTLSSQEIAEAEQIKDRLLMLLQGQGEGQV